MKSIIFITLALFVYESSLKHDNQRIDNEEKSNKTYLNKIEELYRYNNFKASDDKFRIHKKRFALNEVQYTVKHNQFPDSASGEIIQNYLTKLKLNTNEEVHEIPDSLSYQLYCLPPLDQGKCGSCWAFAACAQIEAQLKMINNSYSTYLSPQYLIDCSQAGKCEGGGDSYDAFNFLINQGLVSLDSYEYIEQNQECKSAVPKINVAILRTDAFDLNGDEESLKHILVHFGPVVISVNVRDAFMHYNGHVFFDEKCPNDCNELNHQMLLVGYGTETINYKNIDYWLIKNSFGTDWGESGYIKMIRNSTAMKNNCNVACEIELAIVSFEVTRK